jgi:RNA recognition motif. (a.k.a. RRM, RBD, or RNP domain)
MSLHTERLQNAGRVGTKRFVNPCKVFIGNISFQVQSTKELRAWVIEQMGLPEHVLLKDCQMVAEWKTGKSKGYGFVLFTEPIYATMAITKLNGMLWHDRPLSVLQGIQQKTLQELSLRRERASRERNTAPSVQKDEPSVIYMDAQEAAMLRKLDPDLLDGVQIVSERPTYPITLPDPILDLDIVDEEEDYDDSDDGVDGIWYGDDAEINEEGTSSSTGQIDEEAKNRQQRRDAAKGTKKVKRPRKGFGV